MNKNNEDSSVIFPTKMIFYWLLGFAFLGMSALTYLFYIGMLFIFSFVDIRIYSFFLYFIICLGINIGLFYIPYVIGYAVYKLFAPMIRHITDMEL